MEKRYFKKSKFTSEDGDKYWIFEPTINKKGKGVVQISDNFKRKQRENLGGLDSTFTVLIKKN